MTLNKFTHIYYGCTKAKDKNCKCGYINENDLIKQLQGLVDKVELKENKVLKQLKNEVTRFKKFQLALRGESSSIKVSDKDVRGYVKFILKDGSVAERRDIISSFDSKLSLNNKVVKLVSS